MPERYRLGIRVDVDVNGQPRLRSLEGQVDRISGAQKRGAAATRDAAGALKIYGAQGQVVSTVARRQAAAVQASAAATRNHAAASVRAEKQTRGFAAGLFAVHGRVIRYGAALTGLGGGAYALQRFARETIRAADANVELRNRLRLVTESEQELAAVRGSLIAQSRGTRTELGANAALYSRLALAAETTGHSQAQLLMVTELLNKQVRIGGSNASEAAAGLVQFAQGIASGRLQGDELRSVMENLIGVQQGLVEGFAELRRRGQIDFEVTRGNIRELASEGVLSSDLLLDAILASADATEERWRDVNFGIGESFASLRQEFGLLLDDFEQRTGFFAAIANDIGGLVELRAGAPVDGDVAALERYLEVAERLTLLNPRGFERARDGVRAELLRQVDELRLERDEIAQLTDEQLEEIVGRHAVPTQALVDLVGRAFRLQHERFDFLDARAFAVQEASGAARRELADRAGDPVLQGIRGLSTPPADLEGQREALEQELEGASASARSFRALQAAALDDVGRAEAAYRQRIDLIGQYGLVLADGGAALRLWAAEQRDADLAAAETAQALAEHHATYGAVGVSLGDLTESYGRQRRAILASTDATREEKLEALAALQVRHREALAARAAADAADFEAAKRRASAKAWDLLRSSGVIALVELRQSNARLAAQTDFSRAGLERLRHEQEIEELVLRDLSDASEERREDYREELRLQYELIDQQRLKVDLIERYAPLEVDQADRLRALNDLYAQGALTLRQYARAQADLDIERGEGGFGAGFGSEFGRMLEDTERLNEALGTSFASVFGPDGVIQRGIADSAAASLVLGESFSESLGNVAQRAAAGLVSELIRAYLIAPLLQKALGAGRRDESRAAQASVGQVAGQALTAAGLAAANAYAATAIIPFAGPAAAPAAAQSAFAAALKYGAVATAAQTAAAGAVESKFRYGGVIYGRREFEYAGGRGVAGEAGPEAILPLAQGPAGLGVRNYGVAGRGGPVSLEVNLGGVVVQAPPGTEDPDGFGRAAAQGMIRELRPVFRELLVDEQRPGGVLNRSDVAA